MSENASAMGFILGPVLIVIAVISLLGKMPMSGLAGIRTPHTMASREAWDAAHKASGLTFLIFGTVLVVWAVLMVTQPSIQAWADSPDVSRILQPVTIGLPLVVLIGTAWHADRVALAVTRKGSAHQ